jgi:peptidoglycan/LPS O-acetylase OafA/YrhL
MDQLAALPLALLLVIGLPAPAFANGFNYLVSSMRWSAAGAVVGCLFGMLAALANQVPSNRRAVRVFVTGLGMGLLGGCVSTMGSGRPPSHRSSNRNAAFAGPTVTGRRRMGQPRLKTAESLRRADALDTPLPRS